MEPSTSLPPPSPRLGRRFAIRLTISLAIGAAFVWFMQRAGLRVWPSRSAFAHVRWWTVGAYFALYGVVHFFRAYRWEYLLRPITKVPGRRMIAIAFIGFLAIMLLPFRMGEVVRPYLIREKGKITGSAAMGTIAAERVLDGLYVAMLLAGALALVPRLPLEHVYINGFHVARLPQLGVLTVAVFGSALAVLAFFLWKRRLAEMLTAKLVGMISERLAKRMAQIIGGLADGLRSLPNPRLMIPFTIHSAIYWCTNALTMWMLGWGCGLPMTPGQGFAVMGVLAMGILMPAAPGLFGAFQLAIFAALSMYFPQSMVVEQGTAYVFLMYACQTSFHLIAGIVPIFTEKISVLAAFTQGSTSEPTDEKLPSDVPAS